MWKRFKSIIMMTLLLVYLIFYHIFIVFLFYLNIFDVLLLKQLFLVLLNILVMYFLIVKPQFVREKLLGGSLLLMEDNWKVKVLEKFTENKLKFAFFVFFLWISSFFLLNYSMVPFWGFLVIFLSYFIAKSKILKKLVNSLVISVFVPTFFLFRQVLVGLILLDCRYLFLFGVTEGLAATGFLLGTVQPVVERVVEHAVHSPVTSPAYLKNFFNVSHFFWKEVLKEHYIKSAFANVDFRKDLRSAYMVPHNFAFITKNVSDNMLVLNNKSVFTEVAASVKVPAWDLGSKEARNTFRTIDYSSALKKHEQLVKAGFQVNDKQYSEWSALLREGLVYLPNNGLEKVVLPMEQKVWESTELNDAGVTLSSGLTNTEKPVQHFVAFSKELLFLHFRQLHYFHPMVEALHESGKQIEAIQSSPISMSGSLVLLNDLGSTDNYNIRTNTMLRKISSWQNNLQLHPRKLDLIESSSLVTKAVPELNVLKEGLKITNIEDSKIVVFRGTAKTADFILQGNSLVENLESKFVKKYSFEKVFDNYMKVMKTNQKIVFAGVLDLGVSEDTVKFLQEEAKKIMDKNGNVKIFFVYPKKIN